MAHRACEEYAPNAPEQRGGKDPKAVRRADASLLLDVAALGQEPRACARARVIGGLAGSRD